MTIQVVLSQDDLNFIVKDHLLKKGFEAKLDDIEWVPQTVNDSTNVIARAMCSKIEGVN